MSLPLESTDPLDLGRQALRRDIAALQQLADELGPAFSASADLLAACQGLIWITAVGTSAAVGIRFAHLLTCAGARSMFLSPAEGLHGHAAIMTPDDLLVAISRGGESVEVNQMVAIANARGMKTLALLYDQQSTLARTASVVLPVNSRPEYELMGLLATTSTVAAAAMCDALVQVVHSVKGYSPDKFGQTHPGGAVGQQLSAHRE